MLQTLPCYSSLKNLALRVAGNSIGEGVRAFDLWEPSWVGEASPAACPYSPIGAKIEVPARAVHGTEVAGGGRCFYGVKYEK